MTLQLTKIKKLLHFITAFFIIALLFTNNVFAETISWQQLLPNGAGGSPPTRSSNTNSAWDSNNNRWLIFGGNNGAGGDYFNDLWEYTKLNGWHQLTIQGDPTAPAARTNTAVAWDSQAQRLLVFGGFNGGGTVLNDLWEYTDANGWQQLTANGEISAPGVRDDTTAVWDSTNNRLLVFGGLFYPNANFSEFHQYNDLWQYTTANGWVNLTPDGSVSSPDGRDSHGAAWDAQNNRLLVFGGNTNIGGVRGSNDLWEYTDANGWQQLTPEGAVGSPNRRERGTVTWDDTNDRLLVFGGRTSDPVTLYNDLWQYTILNGWQQLTANGEVGSPEPRGDHTATWDPVENRFLIFAGYNGSGEINDLWQFGISINTPPDFDPIGNKTVNEGEQLQFTLSATDADNDVLAYSAANLPDGATFDPQTATFSWTPTFSQEGNYENVEFTVIDNGSPIELDTELITITVGNVNRAPEFDSVSPQEVLENVQLNFSVQATDQDGDGFTLSATNLPIGSSFNTQTGAFSWTPTLSQSGNYVVTFNATDNGSPVETGTIEVPITVGDTPTPTEQAENLENTVINYNLPTNVENSYLSNLKKVSIFIEKGQIQAAINQLDAFIAKVQQDYSAGKITQAERNDLLSLAQELLADLQ